MGKGDWQQKVRELLEEIEATQAGVPSRDSGITSRVRRDALVRHLDRIRAEYLGLSRSAKL